MDEKGRRRGPGGTGAGRGGSGRGVEAPRTHSAETDKGRVTGAGGTSSRRGEPGRDEVRLRGGSNVKRHMTEAVGFQVDSPTPTPPATSYINGLLYTWGREAGEGYHKSNDSFLTLLYHKRGTHLC